MRASLALAQARRPPTSPVRTCAMPRSSWDAAPGSASSTWRSKPPTSQLLSQRFTAAPVPRLTALAVPVPPSPPLKVHLASGCILSVELGDLTAFRGDAIVNAANESLLGGGGVDGAVHSAAGPELMDLCHALPPLPGRPYTRCPTGEARLTAGGHLHARYVIHAVGPVFDDALISAPLLAATVAYALSLARSYRLRALALPAISCGVYGFPHALAAAVVARVLADPRHTTGLQHVVVVIHPSDRDKLAVWRGAMAGLGGAPG